MSSIRSTFRPLVQPVDVQLTAARVQVVPVEAAEPAPQHEQVAARHDVDRIELQDPQPAQHLPHPVDARGRRRARQVLTADGQPPRLPQAQHEVIRHGPILQDPALRPTQTH
jgi:hypothetical protein